MPRTKADLGGPSEDPSVDSSMHLVSPRKPQMRFEVTLHTTQRAETHPEQVHPAVRLRSILERIEDPVHGADEVQMDDRAP